MEQQQPENEVFSIQLEDFNDGHAPGGTQVPTRIARYLNKQSENFLAVFDGLLSPLWCDRAYQYALARQKPWGAYITTADAQNTSIDAERLWTEDKKERAIALVAVRALILQKGQAFIGKDMQQLHGTAVWCLASGQYQEVKYHIDYAELYRYETNVIFPPVYAGVCQVSPITTEEHMVGGAFKANTGGLDHYRRFGYKCRLSPPESFEKDQSSGDWITINYKQNRGVLYDGNFPHHADEIRYIQPGLNRVILGFNAFTAEVAECNERAPEHSDAFNRTIKLYQRLASLGLPITSESTNNNAASEKDRDGDGSGTPGKKSTDSQKSKISVKEIMKNPALAKLLVKAAKNVKASREKAEHT